jgi:hypothetical protein
VPEAHLFKLTRTSSYNITSWYADLFTRLASVGSAAFATKTAKNSERTAIATLFLSVKPSAAQDFRGVGDADG